MSETKRIDWTSDESVVRAAVPDVYIGRETGWVWTLGNILYTLGETWAEARKHPSVVALDEAHRKVMEKWDSQYLHVVQYDNGFALIIRPFYPDNVGAERVGVGPTEASAILDAASKLEGPSVQGEPKPNFEKEEFYSDGPIPAPREEEGAGEAEEVSTKPWPIGPMSTEQIAISDLVARFADTLRAKLFASEEKYGWNGGWLKDDWQDQLREDIRKHIEKGDPRDVAAYCAFAWHHGWSTTAPVVEEAPRVVTWRVEIKQSHQLRHYLHMEVSTEKEAWSIANKLDQAAYNPRVLRITEEVRTEESADGK